MTAGRSAAPSSETWACNLLVPATMATSDMTAGQMRQLVHDTRYGDVMRAESTKQKSTVR